MLDGEAERRRPGRGRPALDGNPMRVAVAPPATPVIAYATLESLFASMDFCSCDACRWILSPPAYPVALPQFINKPPAGKQNAHQVLFGRRPNIQHRPLPCETTNTGALYDINETLEFCVATPRRHCRQAHGHDTGGAASEDVLASPQI